MNPRKSGHRRSREESHTGLRHVKSSSQRVEPETLIMDRVPGPRRDHLLRMEPRTRHQLLNDDTVQKSGQALAASGDGKLQGLLVAALARQSCKCPSGS